MDGLSDRVGTAVKVRRTVFACLLFTFALNSGGVSAGPSQGSEDARALEQGKPAERELASGHSHHYLLDLLEGQYVRLALEKKSAALVLIVSLPDGEIAEAKSAGLPESLGVVLIARVSGKHRVEVRSLAGDKDDSFPQGPPTLYKLSVAELRTATEADHSGVSAAKAYTKGIRLLEEGGKQSLLGSIEEFKEAMSLFKAAGKRNDEAAALGYIGYAYQKLNQHRDAIGFYIQALRLYKEARDRQSEAATLHKIGLSWNGLGETQKAIEYLNEALPIYRDVGNRSLEAGLLDSLARIYESSDDKRKAIDSYNQALALYRAAGDRRREANAVFNVGRVYGLLDEYRKAMEFYSEALSVYRAIGDRYFEAGLLNALAGSHASLNEYQEALEYFEQSLLIVQSIKNRRGEAIVLNGLGQVYSSLGDHQKALDYLNRALPVLREVGDRANEAATLFSMGGACISSGEHNKALGFYDQALSLYRSIGDRRREAATLNGIGSAHSRLNENRKALESYNQALPLYRATGRRHGEAAVLNNLGRLQLTLGDPVKSLEFHRAALAIIRDVNDRRGEAQMLYNIARAYTKSGDLALARSHAEDAIALAESLRHEVSSQPLRTSFFASVRDYYELSIDVLMHMHFNRPSEGFDHLALEVSERARARSLLELLAEARADIRQGVDATLLERERSLGHVISDKAKRQTQLLDDKHSPERAAANAKEVEDLITEYRQVQARIRATSPRYAALTQPQPITFIDIQQQVLDTGTLLLEYALGDERSYLWAVSPDSITSYELPNRIEIESAARRFYELLRRHGDAETVAERVSSTIIGRGRGELEEAAATLSRILLSPVATHLGSKRLVFVPDGVLHYIPFGALPVPGREGNSKKAVGKRAGYDPPLPLIARHEIVTLPSASVLAEIRRDLPGRKAATRAVAVFADPVFSNDDPRLGSVRRSEEAEDQRGRGIGERRSAAPPLHSGTPAALHSSATMRDLRRSMSDSGMGEGFPRLPFTRREAQAILATVPARGAMRALDFQASRETATGADLSDYRIVHFATHGLLNSRQPELSGIVFSLVDSQGKPQNGFLRLHEIYNMKLPAELVVLSACQTGLGKEIRGEGLVGLTRGFMYAGAPRVVSSLWKVDDAATAELMKRFYAGMFVKKLRPAAALREAQVEMWKQPRWSSSYYWAAFVLQGEWR